MKNINLRSMSGFCPKLDAADAGTVVTVTVEFEVTRRSSSVDMGIDLDGEILRCDVQNVTWANGVDPRLEQAASGAGLHDTFGAQG